MPLRQRQKKRREYKGVFDSFRDIAVLSHKSVHVEFSRVSCILYELFLF